MAQLTLSRTNGTAAATNSAQAGGSSRFWTSAKTLWTVQGLLAVVFLFAGVSKLFMDADTLTKDTWLSAEFLRFIGVAETLGAIGLVLPGIVRVRTGLTPLAAAGLAIIMIGATVLTAANGDFGPAIIPLVIGLLCAYIARQRALRPSRTR
jgi:hypothetical protein